ncbi:MAG: putative porin [Pseudomonadota bacterium]|nr:putative porin [Pseudomonadota bacterium]
MSTRNWIGAVCFSLLLQGGNALADDPIAFEERSDTPAWSFYGDVLLRAERTVDIPGRPQDLERVRSRTRFGVRREFDDFEFGAALEGTLGSDSNQTNRANNDNERSDSINLDELYLRWRGGESTSVVLGKTAFPLATTPLLWDDDFRPLGISASHSIALGEIHRLSLVGGYFAGDHLYDDESRIAAAQIGWHWSENAEVSGDVQLAWLDFSDLQTLVDRGLGRTNRRVAGKLVSDYEILDLQFGLRALIGDALWRGRLDLVRNMGADQNSDGARFSTIYGDSRIAGGLELGFAIQRFQRDAVLAAFTSDDWWFHSFARGCMPWIAYGISDKWRVQLSGFREKRDGIVEPTDRLLLDVRAAW